MGSDFLLKRDLVKQQFSSRGASRPISLIGSLVLFSAIPGPVGNSFFFFLSLSLKFTKRCFLVRPAHKLENDKSRTSRPFFEWIPLL